MRLSLSLAVIVVACVTTPVLSQRWLRQQQLQQQQQAQYCVTPENYYGTCVTLSYCPQIANVFQSANRRQAQQYVILSQRACNTRSINGDPVVCCTRPLAAPQTTESPFQPATSNNPFLPNTRQQEQQPQTTSTTTTPPIIATSSNPTTARLIEDKGSYCRGPDTKEGYCIPIKECQVLVDELQIKQTDERFAKFLRASNKICGTTGTNVCCPNAVQRPLSTSAPLIKSTDETPRRLPTPEEGCGVSNNNFKKVVGGDNSTRGAWPWIALLGYANVVTGSPFKCGGTLVTARHVVTAAHCLLKDLSFVRLGEHDLSTDSEATHVDIRVVRVERHPNYNRRNGHSDIAILYLEHNVDFTKFILPICMPQQEELRQKSYVKYSPFVAGWGKTMEGGTSANILQELKIPIYENQVCRENYREKNRLFTDNQFDAAVICAGVLTGGKDTCQGDSGGPLMIPESFGETVRFYLIGVVSYGIGCARPDVLGVYSSTQYFMDWILEKIADTP